MTKYKLLIEAEIEIDDWVEVDLTDLNTEGKKNIVDRDDEDYVDEYALVLEFCNLTTPETINTAEIKNVKVTKVGTDS